MVLRQFNRIATTVEVIGSCVIVGLIAAGITYAIYKPQPKPILREGYERPYASSGKFSKETSFKFKGKEYKVFSSDAITREEEMAVFKDMSEKGYIPGDYSCKEIDYVSITRDMDGTGIKTRYNIHYTSGYFQWGSIKWNKFKIISANTHFDIFHFPGMESEG